MNTIAQKPPTENTPKTGEGPSAIVVAASTVLVGEQSGVREQVFAATMLFHVLFRRLESENLVPAEFAGFSEHNYSFAPFAAVFVVKNHHTAARAAIDELSTLNCRKWQQPLLHWTVGVPYVEEGDGKNDYWRVIDYGAFTGFPKARLVPHDLNTHTLLAEITRRREQVNRALDKFVPPSAE